MTPYNKLTANEARRRFASLIAGSDEAINLAHAALLIAEEEEPHGAVVRNLALLGEMGDEGRRRVEANRSTGVETLNSFMFDELGFAGDEQNYYDVRNSLLPQVLERRVGLPITLSIVYMEVARRAGLNAEGVGLPGHFIVRVGAGATKETLVDPFYGKVIDEGECQQRLDTMYGGQVVLTEKHLRAMSKREILVRVLRNLQGIYLNSNLHRQALAVIERILLLAPRSMEDHRVRGILLAQMNRLHEAIEELQFYLRHGGGSAEETEAVREQLKKLQAQIASFN
ncbi:MAG: tetratricopeptide repeat protein [Pyrinomonadaceae bacterium]|nr:tetratricopeptide repeat protein [Pyrinomonadaceae bacterium]